jgi:hypothetical protein
MLIANARRVEQGQPPLGLAPDPLPRSTEGTLRPGERWQALFAEWRGEPAA